MVASYSGKLYGTLKRKQPMRDQCYWEPRAITHILCEYACFLNSLMLMIT